MRFHVPALPHTQLTPEYVHCAYTEKIRKFALMMRSLGHEVFVYESDDPLPPEANLTFAFDVNSPQWRRQNRRMIKLIAENVQSRDFLCLIAGVCQKPIADAFPYLQAVEYGIGYHGVFALYRVFESYFHMANVYGRTGQVRGGFFDTVIPNYYDPADFPFSAVKDDYLLFVGRLNEDKGMHVAAQVAELSGLPLVVCGQGTPPAGTDYRGLVQAEERGRLMSRARAVLVPTLYLEPFGGVAVEAQLCGTPVITTDFGAFPETVEHGGTGFRCSYLGEFVSAVNQCDDLRPSDIRRRAVERYALDVVSLQYQKYFERLALLWGQGWNTCDTRSLQRSVHAQHA